jgi:tripartite-type tricarboxylate transporter receptor subunit TctC
MKKLLIGLLMAPVIAMAWEPTKPVEGLIGFGPGSINDTVFRVLSKEVEKNTKATFTVLNRAGAGGVIANEELSKRPADGHTVSVVSVGGVAAMDRVTVPGEGRTYTTDSFTYPMHLAVSPFVIIANTKDPVNTPAKLVEALKKDKVTISAAGGARIVYEELKARVKFKEGTDSVVRVEHKSPTDTLNDVAGGHCQFGIIPAGIANSFYQDKRIAIVAVTGLKKFAPYPDVQPMSVAVKDFDVTADWGLMMPKGTSQEVINWYVKEFSRALNAPEVKTVFENSLLQTNPALHTADKFGNFVKSKEREYKPLVDTILDNRK